jgi:hypothetical protein
VKLVNERGYEFLTDEVVCIHRRTLIVEPFAIAIGKKRDPLDAGQGKLLVAADKAVRAVATSPVQVSHTIFLSPRAEGAVKGASTLTNIASDLAFRVFLAHHLDVGSAMDESIITLLNVVENTVVSRLSYQTFEDLLRSDELVVKLVEA